MAANAAAVARTRERIHGAAVRLFTRKGFHGTGMREISREAGVSLGNLYNHSKNKEDLFAAIMTDLEEAYLASDTPLARAFEEFGSLGQIEALGRACAAMVDEFQDYIRLVYVDVVELEGEHIKRLFGSMRKRYNERFGDRLGYPKNPQGIGLDDPISAMMVTTITFFFVFNIRTIFGVDAFFSPDPNKTIAQISAVLRQGMEPR